MARHITTQTVFASLHEILKRAENRINGNNYIGEEEKKPYLDLIHDLSDLHIFDDIELAQLIPAFLVEIERIKDAPGPNEEFDGFKFQLVEARDALKLIDRIINGEIINAAPNSDYADREETQNQIQEVDNRIDALVSEMEKLKRPIEIKLFSDNAILSNNSDNTLQFASNNELNIASKNQAKVEIIARRIKSLLNSAGAILLKSIEDLIVGLSAIVKQVTRTVLSAASGFAESVKDLAHNAIDKTIGLGKSFKALWDRRIKPPDEETRKTWEREAAVQILMGEKVPARRVPFLQELSLSGWNQDLPERLKAAGADLTEIYVDPDVHFKTVKFSNTDILAKLTALTWLHLSSTQITDITPLEQLTNLTSLYLTDTQITDITPLKQLTNLEWLHLDNAQITDITPLKQLTKLTRLDLIGTQVKDYTPVRHVRRVLGNDPARDKDGYLRKS